MKRLNALLSVVIGSIENVVTYFKICSIKTWNKNRISHTVNDLNDYGVFTVDISGVS